MNIGDTVQLTAGGTELEVVGFTPNGHAIVRWFVDGEMREESFPVACLEVVDEEDFA